jgi:DnaK suppressor protein
MTDYLKIKTELEARLRELGSRSEEIDDELSAPPDSDWSDNAIESENDEVLEEVGELAVEEIQEIKLALKKIADGTYGICVSCGDRIAAKRLEALKHATKCMKCA